MTEAVNYTSYRSISPDPELDFALICFSHLRWDFVWQRPQHLMRRFALDGCVLFWEEPEFGAPGTDPELLVRQVGQNIKVAIPRLPADLQTDERDNTLWALLKTAVRGLGGQPLIRWYYTPMMLPFSIKLPAACTVYDCMDELASFRFAAPELVERERQLFEAADLVFTGGYSLYEAKRKFHRSVHPFPSSVDRAHFSSARTFRCALPDRAGTAPRLGFFGVIDERMDLSLLAGVAAARPDWQIEIVGPIVKIDESELPRASNIIYSGQRRYEDLPLLAAGWDVALMPFALNDSTRFISPTKTPEYLAAGLPVVSTPVTDVVRHYGHLDAVGIASGVSAFVAACERALALTRSSESGWLDEVDRLLGSQSWDATASGMSAHLRPFVAKTRRTTPPRRHYDCLVVGAGFAGSVMAERLAADAGLRVLLIDRRDHIAGNAFDMLDAAGILIHRYGPHVFHTNSAEIFEYLSRFTAWRPYEHRVLANVGDRLVPIPINRITLNQLYGLALTSDEDVSAFLASRAIPCPTIRNSEDAVLAQVGRELYETFFRGYTRKQWGMDPSQLDKSVTSRVPTRTDEDDRYFSDRFQAMPAQGYTAMFRRMLAHAGIDTLLGVDFQEIKECISFDRLVFTGPIDEYFGYCYGKLPYRSLEFRHETKDVEWFQKTGVVNYPSEAVPYTRITEYKHLTGQLAPKTSITYEYPRAHGDPYYPVPCPENQALFARYQALADATSNVLFVGRLATYRYYNMDQIVGQALASYRRHRQEIVSRFSRSASGADASAFAAE
jgi:UDP-galactopyranose mutase